MTTHDLKEQLTEWRHLITCDSKVWQSTKNYFYGAIDAALKGLEQGDTAQAQDLLEGIKFKLNWVKTRREKVCKKDLGGQLWEGCERCGEEPAYLPYHLCEDCFPS